MIVPSLLVLYRPTPRQGPGAGLWQGGQQHHVTLYVTHVTLPGRAQEPDCGKVDSSTMLLVDSGGQYDCGTTDITRTFHFGTPSAHQKRCYTRVLQGHIGLDRVRACWGPAALWLRRRWCGMAALHLLL
jgi:hypothetical protein